MSDMQWRKANGATGIYFGPLVNLGHGIPRHMKDHGIRRALYDLAFGYASGFPVRDVLAFAVRSLFPQGVIPAVDVEVGDSDTSMFVGTVHIACPSCGALMPATVRAEIDDPDGDGLNAQLVCTPDMTDIHAHVWTHSEEQS